MKQLFGDKELSLDFKKIKTTLIQNMLRVHLASVDKRLESCKRCPLITENPGGFKASGSNKNRLDNYTNLYHRKVAYYERPDAVKKAVPQKVLVDPAYEKAI